MAKNDPHKNDPADVPRPDEQSGKGQPCEGQPAETAPEVQRLDAESLGPNALRAELDEAKNRALRLQAEIENVRRRAARELLDERRYANLPLMRDLLPVLDNMDRAVEAAEKSHDSAGLLEGVTIVARQLHEVLARHHCVPIEALHAPFDPHLHEAISQQPSGEHPAGTVLMVTQGGFQLHERVVRPSQVIVACESPVNNPESPSDEDEES